MNMFYDPDSLANIAKDTICRKNPFPPLDGLPSSADGCKWGLTDLYEEDERILRAAISERKTFDTGWVGCKKEIRSFRIISDGQKITIMASAEMDDFNDLIYDAAPDGTEFTDEQFAILDQFWCDDLEICSETMSERTVPLTTYEDAMSILSELEDANDRQLEGWFEVVRSWVADVLENA